MTQVYGLYQTLHSSNYESTFPDENKNDLISMSKKINFEQQSAFLMLICEHAKLNDEFVYNEYDTKLPYSIVQKDKNVIIDFSLLPLELKWILWKFFEVVKNK